MEKLSPKSDFLDKDSTFCKQGKLQYLINEKVEGEVHLFLFKESLLVARKKAINVMKTRSPLKLMHVFNLYDHYAQKSKRNS